MRDLITALDANALRALASALATVAAEAEARAELLDRRQEIEHQAKAEITRLAQLPEIVAGFIADGQTLTAATERVAQASGVPVETVEAHWRSWCHARTAEAMGARRVLILRRAMAGRSNAEIAAELGISRRTVERALSGRRWGKMTVAA